MGMDLVPPFGGSSSIVGPTAAPASGRGVLVQLGKAAALNCNVVAARTVFTTPASGFTRCVLTHIILDNPVGAVFAGNSVSFGSSGAPTDWLPPQVLAAGFVAGKAMYFLPQGGVANQSVYGPGIAFVANVTLGGSATTCDVTVWGYYE